MRVLWGVAAALFLAGVALVVLSVAQGAAQVALVVVIPVVSGSSPVFLGGIGLILAGFVAFLFAATEGWEVEAPPPPAPGAPPSPAPPSGEAGGFVLIGPVPIVFGSWHGVSRRARALLALVGALMVIVVVIVLVGLVR